jgi:7-keto-8-aminopelargonate synthetase-like enzyme
MFATFSKALASVGGFVAGDKPVIEYLRHNVRTLIFSAALPPSSTAAALAALHVMQKDPGIFERMWENVAFFKRGVEELGYHTLGTRTPIVPLWIGSEGRAFQYCREAFELGLFTTPAMYPAVPKGHAIIRTSVTPSHKKEHLQAALDILEQLIKRHPLPQQDPDTIPPARETDIVECATKMLEDPDFVNRM